MNEIDCIAYWRRARERVARLDRLDDSAVVFGARKSGYQGLGHDYQILPRVTDVELLAFESNTGLALPVEYRTFLREFGAGGAGPDYGIADFREHVMSARFDEPFPYQEELWWEEVADDDPIWDLPGLALLCSHGCGHESYLELNGPAPGTVWSHWGQALSNWNSSLVAFYGKWLDKVEVGLERYQLLKSFIDEGTGKLRPAGLRLADVADRMACPHERGEPVGEDEIWVAFEKTPGRVCVNRHDEVIQIDVYRRNGID